ncbi:hypothetical protein WJX82_002776 [Trebouxia sp. C0006]
MEAAGLIVTFEVNRGDSPELGSEQRQQVWRVGLGPNSSCSSTTHACGHTMERSYSGMNSAYYVGMESAFYCPPEKFTSSDLKEYLSGFDTSPTSGSSSNTATQMTGMEDLPEDVAQEMPVDQAPQAISAVLDRPLPIRKRQRKPMKKSRAELEAESAPVVARRKPGRKPKATSGAVGRPKCDASAVKPPKMELGRKAMARAPAPPALPRELPARFTPKKMWAEDEDDTAPRRGRAVSLARTESDYSPAASPVRKAKAPAQRPRQLQEGRPPAPKGQKEGGPCAVCFATKSATWRRGAQGGKHSGEPLCNKCGVWEFRHPDSPPRDEMDFERGSISRRGSSISGVSRRLYAQARAPVHQPLMSDLARALSRQPSTDDEARDAGMAQTDTPAMAAPAFTAPAATVGSGGVLSLQTNGAFTTTQPIQCIISLPAAQLAGVTVLAPQTQVLLRNGFSPSKLTAAVAGSSTLLANGLAAASGSLSASGAGTIAIAGNLGGLQVANTGSGTIFTSGVASGAAAAVSGSGKSVLIPVSGSAVTSQPGSTGTVTFVNGKCTVSGSAAPTGVCTEVSQPTVPAQQVTWTCGLAVTGNFQCSGGAGSVGQVTTPAPVSTTDQAQNINFDGNHGVSSSSEAVGQNSASAFSSSESTPSGSTGTTETSSDGQGFGLQASNPAGGSAQSVSGTGGTTSTGLNEACSHVD